MKKIILFVLLVVGTTASSLAQENVVSLHLQPLAFNELRVGFEHAVTDKFSVIANLGYKLPGDLPNFVGYSSPTPASYGVPVDDAAPVKSFKFVPEFRLYFKENDQPKGMYASAYFRFSRASFGLNYVVDYTFTPEEYADLPADAYPYVDPVTRQMDVNVVADNKFGRVGFGLQLGYQWLIADKVSIDLYFLGIEIDRYKLTTEVYSPDANDLGIDYRNWEAEIKKSVSDGLDDVPLNIDYETTVESDKIIGVASTIFPGVRGGLKVGYAF